MTPTQRATKRTLSLTSPQLSRNCAVCPRRTTASRLTAWSPVSHYFSCNRGFYVTFDSAQLVLPPWRVASASCAYKRAGCRLHVWTCVKKHKHLHPETRSHWTYKRAHRLRKRKTLHEGCSGLYRKGPEIFMLATAAVQAPASHGSWHLKLAAGKGGEGEAAMKPAIVLKKLPDPELLMNTRRTETKLTWRWNSHKFSTRRSFLNTNQHNRFFTEFNLRETPSVIWHLNHSATCCLTGWESAVKLEIFPYLPIPA